MNLDWLLERFGEAGDRPALIWRDREFSYRWLLDRIAFWREQFASTGLASGTIVALESDYSPDACALFLALIQRNAIAVPLSPGAARNRNRFCEIAEVQIVFRCEGGDLRQVERFERTPENPLNVALREAGHPGLVLFSSGSTGESKAALHDLTKLLAKYRERRQALRTLAFLLFDHIGGINTLFHVLANTGTVVIADERAPDAICALIERHRVELLPTSPTFLNLLLLSEAHLRHDLSPLKTITYGTEPMPESTLARLHALLPGVRLAQTYGLSELGILRAKSKSSDSLLVKVGGEGFETKVVNGVLWIRAESAMLGYLNAPSPFDAEGWFNTEDEVEAHGEFLRILGRRSEVINVGGEKVYPAEVESVVQSLPNVLEVCVRGETNPITGQSVVAYVTLNTPEPIVSLRSRIRSSCRERLAPHQVPAKVIAVAGAQHNERFKKIRRAEPVATR